MSLGLSHVFREYYKLASKLLTSHIKILLLILVNECLIL